MSYIGAYRLANALENGTISGAQLEALLADERYKSEYRTLMTNRERALRSLRSANFLSSAITAPTSFVELFTGPDSLFDSLLTEFPTLLSAVSAVALTPATMNSLFADTDARALINSSYEAGFKPFELFKDSDVAVSKFLAAEAGLTISDVVSSMSLYDLAATESTALSAAKAGITFALNSTRVGMLERDVSTTSGAMAVSADAPITLTNNSSLFFLALANGQENVTGAAKSLSGTNATNVSFASAPTNSALSTLAAMTFSALRTLSLANPAEGLKVGRVQGIVNGVSTSATLSMLGVIGIPCQ